MSRRGNCWDNVCSKMLFGYVKVERFHWQRFKTCRQAKDEARAWMRWYSRDRLLSTPPYVSPAQLEQDGLAAQLKQANSYARLWETGSKGKSDFDRLAALISAAPSNGDGRAG